jgi:GTPase SAR1 family protein
VRDGDGDADPPLPLAGTTLIVGPSNVGKTRLTARALTAWLDREGPEGVVVFEFAPEVERGGRVLGGRLDRFVTPPPGVWRGVLDAHAPRATADTDDEAVSLAADNARRAATILDAAPADPRAVFVNDATIPFQTPDADPSRLLDYCEGAEVVVLNALEADAIVDDDPVSEAERTTLATFRERVDRVVRLDDQTDSATPR